MPYIKQEDKERLLEKYTYPNSPDAPSTPGELNFLFTTLITEYLEGKGVNYQAINDVIGALEGAKLEFYRRVVLPYEDLKIIENGDVY